MSDYVGISGGLRVALSTRTGKSEILASWQGIEPAPEIIRKPSGIVAVNRPMRGRCSECLYSFPLRKDGTVRPHRLFCGSERLPKCAGSGLPPAVLRPPTPEGDAGE